MSAESLLKDLVFTLPLWRYTIEGEMICPSCHRKIENVLRRGEPHNADNCVLLRAREHLGLPLYDPLRHGSE